MKSLLMIAALIGISYSGIAQHTTTKHKTTAKHTKTSTKQVAHTIKCASCKEHKASYTATSVAVGGREATWQRLLNCSSAKRVAEAKRAPAAPVAQTVQSVQPCYSYRKNNILVTECPGVMTAPGQMEMSSQSSYLGYYPQAGTLVTVNPVLAPQPNVINNTRGAAPSSGNFCGSNCSSR